MEVSLNLDHFSPITISWHNPSRQYFSKVLFLLKWRQENIGNNYVFSSTPWWLETQEYILLLGDSSCKLLKNVLTKRSEDPVRGLISVALQHTLLVPEQDRQGLSPLKWRLFRQNNVYPRFHLQDQPHKLQWNPFYLFLCVWNKAKRKNARDKSFGNSELSRGKKKHCMRNPVDSHSTIMSLYNSSWWDHNYDHEQL